MDGPVFTAPRSAFDGPAYQQGYHFAGAAQGDQAYAYDGASDYQQAFSPGGGMMQAQMQPSFAACRSSPAHPIRSALQLLWLASSLTDSEAKLAPAAAGPKL